MTEVQEESINLIIVVAVIAVIVVVVGTLIYLLNSSNPVEKCRASVLAVDKTKTGLTLEKSPLSIDCPRIDRNVKLKDVKNPNGTVSENLIKKEIAEAMRQCWYKMGEGQLIGFNSNLITQEESCVICGKVSFEKSIGDKLKKQQNNPPVPILAGMYEYLKYTNIPNSEITYTEYIRTSSGHESSHIIAWDPENEIFRDTSYFTIQDINGRPIDYFVVFQVKDKSAVAKHPVAGCVASILIGAAGGYAVMSIAGALGIGSTATAVATTSYEVPVTLTTSTGEVVSDVVILEVSAAPGVAGAAGATKLAAVIGAVKGTGLGLTPCLISLGLSKAEETKADLWVVSIEDIKHLKCDQVYQ